VISVICISHSDSEPIPGSLIPIAILRQPPLQLSHNSHPSVSEITVLDSKTESESLPIPFPRLFMILEGMKYFPARFRSFSSHNGTESKFQIKTPRSREGLNLPWLLAERRTKPNGDDRFSGSRSGSTPPHMSAMGKCLPTRKKTLNLNGGTRTEHRDSEPRAQLTLTQICPAPIPHTKPRLWKKFFARTCMQNVTQTKK